MPEPGAETAGGTSAPPGASVGTKIGTVAVLAAGTVGLLTGVVGIASGHTGTTTTPSAVQSIAPTPVPGNTTTAEPATGIDAGCIGIAPNGPETTLSFVVDLANPQLGSYHGRIGAPGGSLDGTGTIDSATQPLVIDFTATQFGSYGPLTLTGPDGTPIPLGPLGDQLPFVLDAQTDVAKECHLPTPTDEPSPTPTPSAAPTPAVATTTGTETDRFPWLPLWAGGLFATVVGAGWLRKTARTHDCAKEERAVQMASTAVSAARHRVDAAMQTMAAHTAAEEKRTAPLRAQLAVLQPQIDDLGARLVSGKTDKLGRELLNDELTKKETERDAIQAELDKPDMEEDALDDEALAARLRLYSAEIELEHANDALVACRGEMDTDVTKPELPPYEPPAPPTTPPGIDDSGVM